MPKVTAREQIAEILRRMNNKQRALCTTEIYGFTAEITASLRSLVMGRKRGADAFVDADGRKRLMAVGWNQAIDDIAELFK